MTESACRFIYNAERYWLSGTIGGRSISGVKFKKVGDKFSDTRVDLILDLKKNDFFLEKTYNGKVSFTTGNRPFSSGKTILFEFRRFLLPRKIVDFVV